MNKAVRSAMLMVLCFVGTHLSVPMAAPADSPVADAAMQGDAETVRLLLAEGADVQTARADGLTALHWAAMRSDLELAENLPELIENALTRVLLDRLGLEMRVGSLILGTQRIAETARGGAVALLLHARDASEDGRKKLDQAWRVGRQSEGSGERGLELPLDRDALSVALGRDNVVHLALADEAAAARVMKALARLTHYLGHDLPAADGRVSARADDELND